MEAGTCVYIERETPRWRHISRLRLWKRRKKKKMERKEVKIFGVKLLIEEDEVMRKSKSMGNLSHAPENGSPDNGYLSDGLGRRGGRERKRGVPWTEEEHRTFLAGLQRLGKGDWRGIARNFVTTRTPTQVASHAQKYFLRQSTQHKKKRRSSLFDVVIGDTATERTSPLSRISSYETSEKNLMQHKNIQVTTAAGMVNQATIAFPSLSLGTKVDESLDVSESNAMVESQNEATRESIDASSKLSLSALSDISDDLKPDASQLNDAQTAHGSNFLQLSFKNQSDIHCQLPSTLASTSVDSSDLELRIAPPQAINAASLSSEASATSGAIKVI